MPKLDADGYDRRILGALQRDGRMSIADLAEKVGLSSSPCWRRVRALEEAGVIRGYTAILDPAAIGFGLDVFVSLSLNLHKAEEFEAAIMRRPEVVQCYAMAGEQDYMLHVIARDMAAFDHFVRDELIHMPGVDKVRSNFILKVIKQTTVLPL